MKKRDIILIASVLIVAIALYLVVELTKKEGAGVVVTVDGKEVARYSLSIDGDYVLNNGTNVLKIEDGKAWMLDANCPQNSYDSCTKKGKISKTNETIVCLPNKLAVTVYGAGENVDLIS